MQDYRIRRASVSDAPAIARQRVRMFQEMGELSLDETPIVESASRARLVDDIASGAYLGWLAEAEGTVVAGAGIVLHAYYPTGANPHGHPTAHLVNVYTNPDRRRLGLAQSLVAEILAWCRANGIPRASLHASRFGRSVYEKLGFEPTNEMRMNL